MIQGPAAPILHPPGGQLLAEHFHVLSHQILRCAHRSVSTTTFLLEVSRILLDSSGCDAVELETEERGKVFRADCWLQPDQSMGARAHPGGDAKRVEGLGDTDHNRDLFSLCREALRGRLVPAPPFLTSYGSFWTGGAQETPGSLPGADAELCVPRLDVAPDYRSLALIPFVINHTDAGSVLLASRRLDVFHERQISYYERLAETIGIAVVLRRSQVALQERVKELTCLYRLARLADRQDLSLDGFLQSAAELLPAAWLHPEVAVGQIILDERSFSTSTTNEVWCALAAPIVISGKPRGSVQVAYDQKRPEFDEGPFLNEERSLIDAVAREIALIVERKEADAKRARLEQQLRHANRLARIGEFVAGVAHELNEPLGSILGFAQLTQKNPALPQESRQDIEKIVAASLHAREIITELLIFARQVPPEMTTVDLNEVVEDTLYLLESRCAREGIEVVRSLSRHPLEIVGEPAQLRQVLVNLVVNSIQAMPTGGRLTIATEADDEHAALIIEDTGVGMSDEVRKQVFVPFFTTKEIGQGTGLGLAVVHGIVTSHGGSISVESEPGGGSRFEVRIPRTRVEDTSEETQDDEAG